ncbi:RNA polymerase II-associated protein 3-like isoform X1 [Belonocnema kinseyi]|uniref:RNA polymerase II-associated protein 3-like isoform X1 n=1 Tax=Belonocnema kinseyi TaxID=2817044 RepID=UPI00143D6921|nr:RNA polymerase II-associated protein 3-like isoform X1 [Belonocnema kinseyi]
MDKDNSILLQKQVRDNSADLQKELIDLRNWEQEMKRKEAALLSAGRDQVRDLPPIRSKKKKTIESSPPIASTSKSAPDRIRSSDYTAWDKFDVDAEIRKLEEDNDSDGSVEDVQENAEKKYTQATKFKEQGNIFVQKRLYDKAIKSYTEAIKIFPYDEVFYANRALCYLKIQNLYSAEADCTASLQLNDCYVKAYHRRATARMELEEYDGAKKDIERMLDLEPTNKEAKLMFAQVNKKLEKSKPRVSSVSTSLETSVEKKIGEKLWNTGKLKEETAIQKQMLIDMMKIKERPKSTGVTITEIPNDSEQDKERVKEKVKEPVKEQVKEKIPDWLPELNDDFSIVKPVKLSPHLRSKKPLKRIPVTEADFENSILPKLEKEVSEKIEKSKVDENLNIPGKSAKAEKSEEDSTKVEKTEVENQQSAGKKSQELTKPSLKNKIEITKSSSFLEEFIQEQEDESKKMKENSIEVNIAESKDKKNLPSRKTEIERPKIIEIVETVPDKVREKTKVEDSFKVPPAPKTSVQFLMDWKLSKSLNFRYLYLKQITPEVIPVLFKDSMESDIFNDIICILKEKFILKEKNVFQYLEHLSNVKRFRTLIMFIERSTKEALKELLKELTKEGKSEEEIDELRRKYEL